MRDEIIDRLFVLFRALLDYCTAGDCDMKQVKALTDVFNTIYRRADYREQGEFHALVADFMK